MAKTNNRDKMLSRLHELQVAREGAGKVFSRAPSLEAGSAILFKDRFAFGYVRFRVTEATLKKAFSVFTVIVAPGIEISGGVALLSDSMSVDADWGRIAAAAATSYKADLPGLKIRKEVQSAWIGLQEELATGLASEKKGTYILSQSAEEWFFLRALPEGKSRGERGMQNFADQWVWDPLLVSDRYTLVRRKISLGYIVKDEY